jgi:hypothetical protein
VHTAGLGLSPLPRDEHAAYLGHWLNVLKTRQTRNLRRVGLAVPPLMRSAPPIIFTDFSLNGMRECRVAFERGRRSQTSSINGTTMSLKCVSVFEMQCISIPECAQRLTDLTYFGGQHGQES